MEYWSLIGSVAGTFTAFAFLILSIAKESFKITDEKKDMFKSLKPFYNYIHQYIICIFILFLMPLLISLLYLNSYGNLPSFLFVDKIVFFSMLSIFIYSSYLFCVCKIIRKKRINIVLCIMFSGLHLFVFTVTSETIFLKFNGVFPIFVAFCILFLLVQNEKKIIFYLVTKEANPFMKKKFKDINNDCKELEQNFIDFKLKLEKLLKSKKIEKNEVYIEKLDEAQNMDIQVKEILKINKYNRKSFTAYLTKFNKIPLQNADKINIYFQNTLQKLHEFKYEYEQVNKKMDHYK